MYVIIVLIALVSTALAEQTWVEFEKGREGAEPQLTVLESGFSGTTINLKTSGMWVEDVKVDKETYQRITLPASHTGEVGKPMLPVIRKLVAIPATAGVEVKVTSKGERVYTDYLVYPTQEPRMENEPEPPFEKDDDFYDSDTQYPVKLSEVGAPAIMNDVRLVELTIQPFRYNAKTKELTVATDLTVYLDYSGVDERNQLKRQRSYFSRQWERLYRSLLFNFDDIYNPVRISTGPPPPALTFIPVYLVIYADAYSPENLNAVVDLISWKTRKGMKVDTINLNRITSPARDTMAVYDVKAYIQYWRGLYFMNPKYATTYVLLVGDVPDREPGPGNCSSIQCADANHVPSYAFENATPSDYFYQLVAGDDYYPDLAIGRWCVEDSAHLIAYLNKTINYEMTPDSAWECEKSLFVAAFEDKPQYTFEDDQEYIRDTIMPDPSNVTLLYGSDAGTHNDDIQSAIDNDGQNYGGVGIVNYRGHGFVDCWGWKDSAASEAFETDDILDLAQSGFDGYPVVYNVCCLNGRIVHPSRESMVEAWTRYENCGGVGALGASMESIGSLNTLMDKEIFRGHFDDILNCGMSINKAKTAVFDHYGEFGGAPRHLHKYYWIGDPELDVWRGRANPAKFDYLYVEDNTIHIRVIQDAECQNPIADAKVCVYRDYNPDPIGVYQEVGYTNANGYVSFACPPDFLGITVTATNQWGPITIRPVFGSTSNAFSSPGQSEPLIDFIDWQLKPIYPNPLHSSAVISYSVAGRLGIKESQPVELSVFDVTGRKAKVLVSDKQSPGYYEIIWNGCDSKGLKCPSGVYFIRMRSNEFDANERLVLLR